MKIKAGKREEEETPTQLGKAVGNSRTGRFATKSHVVGFVVISTPHKTVVLAKLAVHSVW